MPAPDDGRGYFAPEHRWDRNFFLVMAALAWLGIIRGFGGDIQGHIARHDAPFPLIVHFHAVAFVGWLVLFTAQILLIRFKKWHIHRKLGLAMACLAVVMVILGPSTALTVQHMHMGEPGADPAFLSIQLTDILAFAGFVTAAVVLRRRPLAHKRLILLATIYITDAGYARWLAGGLLQLLGHGFWPMWVALYLGPNLLVLAVGAYDLKTRHHFHFAYMIGVVWVLFNQMTALALYFSPDWLGLANKVIALWPLA